MGFRLAGILVYLLVRAGESWDGRSRASLFRFCFVYAFLCLGSVVSVPGNTAGIVGDSSSCC